MAIFSRLPGQHETSHLVTIGVSPRWLSYVRCIHLYIYIYIGTRKYKFCITFVRGGSSEFHHQQMFFLEVDGAAIVRTRRENSSGGAAEGRRRVLCHRLIVGGGRRCHVRSRSVIVLRKNPTGTDLFYFGRCRYAVGFTCSFF